MKDAQGTKRGECNLCKCSKYVAPVEGDKHSCEYCGHRPTDHVWVLDELGQCRTTGSECYKYVGDDPNSFSDCGYCGCHPYSGRLYGAVKEQCQQHQCCVGMNITIEFGTAGCVFLQVFIVYIIHTGIAPQVCTLRQLRYSELSQVQSHFSSQWPSQKGTCPTITCAFQIVNPQLEARWNTYKPGLPSDCQTVEKHFHGTKLKCDIVNTQSPCNDEDCGICGISKYGMDRRLFRKNINYHRFGLAFYFAPNSSKCHDYTQGVLTHRSMLLVDILPGKKYTIYNNDVKREKPPDGYHSVFGKPGQALNYAELAVYNPDCVMPRYIIVYVHDGVHKIVK